MLMETPKLRGDWRVFSGSDVRTKWLQFSVTSGVGKLKVIPKAELVGKQNAGKNKLLQSYTIFHGNLKEFVDVICFCACMCMSFSFSIWYLSNREVKAVLINGVFRGMVCKPSECKISELLLQDLWKPKYFAQELIWMSWLSTFWVCPGHLP